LDLKVYKAKLYFIDKLDLTIEAVCVLSYLQGTPEGSQRFKEVQQKLKAIEAEEKRRFPKESAEYFTWKAERRAEGKLEKIADF
jgi:hypothetical protein